MSMTPDEIKAAAKAAVAKMARLMIQRKLDKEAALEEEGVT